MLCSHFRNLNSVELKNSNLKECYVTVVCKTETFEAEALELVSQLTTGETVRQLESISLFDVT